MKDYLGGVCFYCGEEEYLEFHHVNPEEKLFNVTSKYSYAWSTLTPELDKCVLICSDCHRLEHKKETLTHNRWRYVTYKCKCIKCRVDYNTYKRERRALGK